MARCFTVIAAAGQLLVSDATVNHRFLKPSLQSESDSDILELISAFRPCAACAHEVRVGGENDGGYPMCKELLSGVTGAYSYGIKGSIDGEVQYLRFLESRSTSLIVSTATFRHAESQTTVVCLSSMRSVLGDSQRRFQHQFMMVMCARKATQLVRALGLPPLCASEHCKSR